MNKKIEIIKKLHSKLEQKLNDFESKNKLDNAEFFILKSDVLCQYNIVGGIVYSNANLPAIADAAYKLLKFIDKFQKNNETKEIKDICKEIFYRANGFDINDSEFAPDILRHYDLDFTQNTIDYLRKTQVERDIENKREKLNQEIKTFYNKIKFSLKYAIFLTIIFTFINYKILNTNSLYEYSTSIFISLFTGISVFYNEFVGIILNITWKIKRNFFIALSKINHYVPSFRRISYKLFELVKFSNKENK